MEGTYSRPQDTLLCAVLLAGNVGVAKRGGEDSQGPTLPPAQAFLPLQPDPGSAQRIHRFEGEPCTLAGSCNVHFLAATSSEMRFRPRPGVTVR